MAHGQIGEGFENAGECMEWPILPQGGQGKRNAAPGSGRERPNLIEEIRLCSIGLVHH